MISRLFQLLLLLLTLPMDALLASSPNVVIIRADDQGWGDLSNTGNSYLH